MRLEFHNLKNHLFFLIFLCLFAGENLFAQTPNSLLWEPEVKFKFSTEDSWKHSFGIASRNFFFTYMEGEKIQGSSQEHIELNHFTSYRLGKKTSAALGFRYRFREIFDDSRYDEFRIIEQFNYFNPVSQWGIAHRFRFEQRLRNIITIYRLRYQIGISRPLSEAFSLGFSTEFLYSMAKNLRPAPDQRFTLEVENSSFANLDLSAGIEYRYEDYTGESENNFIILSGATIKL